MKATGIVRRIDDLGRIVIAKELRRTLGITEGDPLEAFVEGENIILRKYQPGCVFCGNVENAKPYRGKSVCPECAKELGRQ